MKKTVTKKQSEKQVAKPAKMATPVKSAKPAKAAKTATPVKSAKPAKPAKPAASSKAVKPVKPAKSAKPVKLEDLKSSVYVKALKAAGYAFEAREDRLIFMIKDDTFILMVEENAPERFSLISGFTLEKIKYPIEIFEEMNLTMQTTPYVRVYSESAGKKGDFVVLFEICQICDKSQIPMLLEVGVATITRAMEMFGDLN